MRSRKTQDLVVDEENPYWMSFSDIMSALLVIFILASVILILRLMEIQKELEIRKEDFDKQIIQLKKAEEVRRTILEDAIKELEKRKIKVEQSENQTVLSIPSDLLGFETKDFRIREGYQKTAREIGEVLYQVITQDNRMEFIDTIFVEGHTDNQAYNNSQIKGNWGLSTFRAISLWEFWQSASPESAQLSHLKNATDNKPLFSVSGYAETRPVVVDQNGEVARSRNRRIDIRFTIRRPDSTQYEKVKSSLDNMQ